MKLIIHYDVINAILNVNEEMNCFKVIRNSKKRLAILAPSWFLLSYIIQRNIPESIMTTLLTCVLSAGRTSFDQKMLGFDSYKNKSSNDLKKLVSELKEFLYLDTSYDLLLESKLTERNYKINFDKENLLSMLESKYILVPTHDFSGNIKNTSLLQEHYVGSNDYVLSIGLPAKQLKFAYSSI